MECFQNIWNRVFCFFILCVISFSARAEDPQAIGCWDRAGRPLDVTFYNIPNVPGIYSTYDVGPASCSTALGESFTTAFEYFVNLYCGSNSGYCADHFGFNGFWLSDGLTPVSSWNVRGTWVSQWPDGNFAITRNFPIDYLQYMPDTGEWVTRSTLASSFRMSSSIGLSSPNTAPEAGPPIPIFNNSTLGMEAVEESSGCGTGDVIAGNPISIATGQKTQTETDYQSAAEDGLQFSRIYASDSGRWTYNHDYHLRIDPPDASGRYFIMTMIDPSGKAFLFGMEGTDSVNYKGLSNAALTAKRLEGGVYTPFGWEVSYGDGTKIEFDFNGRLQKTTSIRGKTLSYSYAETQNGIQVSVTSNHGEALTFRLNSDNQLIDLTVNELTTTYQYDAQGNLTDVLYPDATPGDNSDNPRKYYLYENVQFPHALTGLIDERGERYATWAYDDKGRAITSYHGQEKEKVSIEYQDGSSSRTRTVTYDTDEGGQRVVTYQFNTGLNGVEQLVEVNSPTASHCPASNVHYTYDSLGFIKTREVAVQALNGEPDSVPPVFQNSSSTDQWIVEETLRNTQGLITRDTTGLIRVDGVLSEPDQAFRTETQYDAIFPLPTHIATYEKQQGEWQAINDQDLQYDVDNARLTTLTVTDATQITTPYPTQGRSITWNFDYLYYDENKTQLQTLIIDGPRTDLSDLTTYAYSPQGVLIQVTNALNQTKAFSDFNAYDEPKVLTDVNGVEAWRTFNPRGWLITSTIKGSEDATTQINYLPNGLVQSWISPTGETQTYAYTSAGYLQSLTRNNGDTQELTPSSRDGQWRIAESYDATHTLRRRQERHFDELGRVIEALGTQGQKKQWSYNALGLPYQITEYGDQQNRITDQQFDHQGHLYKISYPDQTTTFFTHDARGLRTQVQDPKGHVTDYRYDGFGRLIQQTSPDTGTTVYHYDEAGNLTEKTDANGRDFTYLYDALNRLTEIKADGVSQTQYAYDQGTYGLGRLTQIHNATADIQYQYTARGQLARETQTVQGYALTTQYQYTAADRLQQMTYPSGKVVLYQYDSAGQIASVSIQYNGQTYPIASALTWLPFGPLADITYGNGLHLTHQYDQDYRLTALMYGSTPIQTNVYDAFDQLTRQTSLGSTWSYGYDLRSRLQQAANGSTQLDYAYDDNSNRLSDNANSYGIDADSNRLLSQSGQQNQTYAYDAAGNLLSDSQHAYHYDAQSQLTGIDTTIQYAYNGLHQRIEKVVNGQARYFLYDHQGQLLAEYNGQGQLIQELIYLEDQPLASARNGQLYYIHLDRLGTPRMITNSAKQTVWSWLSDPFGTTVANEDADGNGQTFEFNLRFPGQYRDKESGLFYNWHRYYDPGTGRYITSDPIGLDGGLNTYAYVSNSPLMSVDPLGLAPNPGEAACVLGPNPVCVAGIATDVCTSLLVGGAALGTLLSTKEDDESKGEDSSAAESSPQDKKLTEGEIDRLIDGEVHPHDLKDNSKQDLFKNKDGYIFVKPRGGIGPGDPTGLNINDF